MRKRKPPDEKNQTPQGSQSQTGQGGDGDAPKFVTEEQLNRAITARFGDFQKKIEKSLGESIANTIGTKLEELKTSLQSAPPGGDTKDTPKGADLDNHPLVKGLQKQLEEQRRATEQIKNDRDAEKSKARDASLRQRLSDALTKGGIDPRYVRQAAGVLIDVEKRVRFSDDDAEDLIFKDSTGDVDLDTGLKSWLKGDDAKIYLPPRGTQGTGDRSGGKTTPGAQPPTVGATLLGMARVATEGSSQG